MYSFSILFIYFIFHHHKDVQVCCCRQRNQLDLSLQKQKFIPVLHNLLPNTAVQYASVLHEANLAFTTSMRHESALATITELSRICHDNNKNQVIATDHRFTFGVSTMHDVTQVIPIKNSGVSFLSTTQVCSDVLEASRKVDIPVLCGVSSLMEARQALKLGALGLKFYPSSAVSPTQLSSILYHLNKENREYTSQLIHDDSSLMSLSSSKRNVVTGDEITSSSADRLVYILVAGGVTPESAIEYTRAGATHFCIGYDCRVLSPTDILSSIQLYENALLLCKDTVLSCL